MQMHMCTFPVRPLLQVLHCCIVVERVDPHELHPATRAGAGSPAAIAAAALPAATSPARSSSARFMVSRASCRSLGCRRGGQKVGCPPMDSSLESAILLNVGSYPPTAAQVPAAWRAATPAHLACHPLPA